MGYVSHHRKRLQPKISQFCGLARRRGANRYQVADLAWAQLLASRDIDAAKILTSAQVTDTYLLALNKVRGSHLGSFDRKLSLAAVKGGKSALHLIPTR